MDIPDLIVSPSLRKNSIVCSRVFGQWRHTILRPLCVRILVVCNWVYMDNQDLHSSPSLCKNSTRSCEVRYSDYRDLHSSPALHKNICVKLGMWTLEMRIPIPRNVRIVV